MADLNEPPFQVFDNVIVVTGYLQQRLYHFGVYYSAGKSSRPICLLSVVVSFAHVPQSPMNCVQTY